MRTLLTVFHAELLTATANQALPVRGTTEARRPDPRKSLVVTFNVAGFIGGSLVSTTNGYPVVAGKEYAMDATDGLYFFSTTTGTVNILEGF